MLITCGLTRFERASLLLRPPKNCGAAHRV